MKDIVTQLRANSECLAPSIMLAAAAEIERLREERDEARQMYCKMTSRDNVESARYIADRHGWDCFKEDGK
jgi:hypothetical protein